MNQSNDWLNEAKQLCDEIGPEDGVDPRIIARAMDRKSKNHKSKQLGKEARHTLSMVFTGELSDPVFQDLEVVDVAATDDGQFLIVSLACIDTSVEIDETQILKKCRALQGYLRSAIAWSVKRKRVPALKFELIQVDKGVSRNAYSKNNQ